LYQVTPSVKVINLTNNTVCGNLNGKFNAINDDIHIYQVIIITTTITIRTPSTTNTNTNTNTTTTTTTTTTTSTAIAVRRHPVSFQINVSTFGCHQISSSLSLDVSWDLFP
jgi:hypothetical protein